VIWRQSIAAQTVHAGGAGFFDALAPIIDHDSIDMSKAWMQSPLMEQGRKREEAH